MTTELTLAVSIAEAAKLLGISNRHAYNLVRAGTIPTTRLGSRIVISRKALEAMLAGEAGRE